MSVELILASGSRAGMRAAILRGYYMIGRHAECQIRPKTRSVSRRHCLVHHEAGTVRVLDLRSTSGTKVNEEKLEPLDWRELHDGDQLRCGKIVFDVTILGHAASKGGADSDARSLVRGAAWEEFDIAAFLKSADDEDREQRYEAIRAKSAAAADSVDEDPFPSSDSDDRQNAAPSGFRQGTDAGITDADKTACAKRQPANPPPGRLKKRRSALGRSSPFEGETWKLALAGFVAVFVLTFLAYKVYQFNAPPPVRVIDGID